MRVKAFVSCRRELFAKQSRVSQFASKADRDRWIKTQPEIHGKAREDKEKTINRLIEEIKKDEERRESLEKDLAEAEEKSNAIRSELENVSEDSRRLRREKDETQADQQTVCREETRIAEELNNYRDELARTEHGTAYLHYY